MINHQSTSRSDGSIFFTVQTCSIATMSSRTKKTKSKFVYPVVNYGEIRHGWLEIPHFDLNLFRNPETTLIHRKFKSSFLFQFLKPFAALPRHDFSLGTGSASKTAYTIVDVMRCSRSTKVEFESYYPTCISRTAEI